MFQLCVECLTLFIFLCIQAIHILYELFMMYFDYMFVYV